MYTGKLCVVVLSVLRVLCVPERHVSACCICDFSFNHTWQAQRCPFLLTSGSDTFSVTNILSNLSNLQAQFSAISITAARDPTMIADGDAVRELGEKLPDDLDAAGDPCLPTPWAWLFAASSYHLV
ncbi:hypothetical protein R1flu_008085 [Riccia fluitans]|uniref:Secreted protein n=1 Tax=Riccia fluitans TaxID=41844 RepID=A0ABD1YBC8_9MARC